MTEVGRKFGPNAAVYFLLADQFTIFVHCTEVFGVNTALPKIANANEAELLGKFSNRFIWIFGGLFHMY